MRSFRKLVLSLLVLTLSSPVMGAWFPAPVQTVDFSQEELSTLDEEFHQAFDADIAALGGRFELKFFKLIFSYLATATVQDNVYKVSIMAGNLSKKSMTMDSLRLLICHEVGHFLGGGPRRIELDPAEDQLWNVIEGGADYFATTQCMKRILKGQDHALILASFPADSEVATECKKSFTNTEHIAICQRSMMASKQMIKFFAAAKKVENTFRFETPDLTVVSKTNPAHPELQCRLDTLKSGATCNVDPQILMNPLDLSQGTCSNRPACWFKD